MEGETERNSFFVKVVGKKGKKKRPYVINERPLTAFIELGNMLLTHECLKPSVELGQYAVPAENIEY